MTNQPYIPISCSFHDWIEAVAIQRLYVKIQYFTEIRELITVNALIKDWVNENNEEFMLLASGEKIRFDRIVSIAGKFSPDFAQYEDYSCDC
jgi:Rho-binding antiterminator